MRPVTFVLTVPHAACDEANFPSTFNHVCDLAAPTAAAMLREALVTRCCGRDGSRVIGPIMGNVNRMQKDLNRKESRGTGFRQKIVEILDKLDCAPNCRCTLLDIHSYDSHASWCAKAVAKGRPEPLIVLMESSKYPTPDPEISQMPERVWNILPRQLQSLTVVDREQVVDVVKHAREHGAMNNLLIEFNESLLYDRKLMATVVQNLADAIGEASNQHFC